MVEFQQNSLDVNIWSEQMTLFRRLAKKYGLAMIVLTMNNFITPIVLILIVAVIGKLIGVDFLADDTDTGYYTAIILNEIAAYTVPVLVFAALFREERKNFIPDRTYNPPFYEAILMFMTSMAAGAVGSMVTNLINSGIDAIFGTGEIEEVFSGMEPANIGQFGIFAFCICVVAPVTEEIIFRDLLLKPLRAYGDLTAAIITGVMFGLYHGNFDQFAYATLVGFFFSVIAIRFNSVIPTMILHCVNNTIVTFSSYLEGAVSDCSQPVKDTCAVITDICTAATILLMAGGAISFVFILLEKCLKLNNHNPYVPEPHSLIDFVKVPWVIGGIVAMVFVFFV